MRDVFFFGDFFFFFNDTATTEIYTLSLHDALPIRGTRPRRHQGRPGPLTDGRPPAAPPVDSAATNLREIRRHALLYAGLAPFLVAALFPVIWMAITAFKEEADLYRMDQFPLW